MEKKLVTLLIAGVSSLILLSCNKKDTKKDTEFNKMKSEEKITEDNIGNLTLQFEGSEDFSIKNPKFKVILYGYDPLLADAPAILITEQEYEEDSIPFTINMPVPQDVAYSIDPKIKDRIKYYVSIEWDSDGNGKVGEKSDIYIDHDKEFPNVKLTGETQKIYLKILK